MSLGAGVYAKLAGDVGVAALVGTRIYPEAMPQDSDLPAITWGIAGVTPIQTIGVQTAQWEAEVSMSCWAETDADAATLAAAVVAAVDHDNTGWTGLTVLGCWVSGQGMAFDRDFERHERSVSVILTHR